MNMIDDVFDMLECEMSKYTSKEELSPSEWKMMFEAIDAYKDLVDIVEKSEEMAEKYGGGMMMDDGGSSSRSYRSSGNNSYGPMRQRRMWMNNSSYANGSGMWGGMSRNGGMMGRSSYHGESFQDQLRRLMDSATNDSERAAVQDLMNNLQNR